MHLATRIDRRCHEMSRIPSESGLDLDLCSLIESLNHSVGKCASIAGTVTLRKTAVESWLPN